MLKVKSGQSIPSVSSVINILTMQNQRLGIPMDFDRLCEYNSYYSLKAHKIKKQIESAIGYKGTAGSMTDNDFKAWLKRHRFTEGFLATDAGDISLNVASCEAAIAAGCLPPEVNVLLKLKSEMSEYSSMITHFENIIETYPVVPLETYDNHRMILVHPTWSAQNTVRIGASDPAVMNISKLAKDVFTAPKGWIHWEVDSGQIDPRISISMDIRDEQIKKCVMLYNDAYYGFIHYCTVLTDEQRRSGTLDLQPIEITEAIKKKRALLKTYANGVMYGSTENINNDPDKAAFIKYIGKHPARIKLVKDLEDRIDRGQRVFTAYFGTEIDITAGPSERKYTDKTSEAYFSHLLKTAINCRIQGTAAELMRLSVYTANMLLTRKAPNSIITQYVHDSGKFLIHEDDYDAVMPELREITSYQVEDWIPIYAEGEEGFHNTSGLPRLV